jgi:hypothetical protein
LNAIVKRFCVAGLWDGLFFPLGFRGMNAKTKKNCNEQIGNGSHTGGFSDLKIHNISSIAMGINSGKVPGLIAGSFMGKFKF